MQNNTNSLTNSFTNETNNKRRKLNNTLDKTNKNEIDFNEHVDGYDYYQSVYKENREFSEFCKKGYKFTQEDLDIMEQNRLEYEAIIEDMKEEKNRLDMLKDINEVNSNKK